jgi:SAM-dependent methyltransferase
LECGCGSGRDTALIAAVAQSVTGIDLNTSDIARKRNSQYKNVHFIEADIATMRLGQTFDVVICVGVIHHTDNPDITFKNIYEHCRPGGTLVLWVYSAEGNALMRWIVEPIRKAFLTKLSRPALRRLSTLLTALMYPLVYTVYFLPAARRLPYYEYFQVFRKMDFERNMINVFDKLNAPQTHFITRKRCEQWFNSALFDPQSVVIRNHLNVSYTLLGVKKA